MLIIFALLIFFFGFLLTILIKKKAYDTFFLAFKEGSFEDFLRGQIRLFGFDSVFLASFN